MRGLLALWRKPTVAVTQKSLLATSIENAEEVLAFASNRGIVVDEECIKHIVSAKRGGKDLSEKQEADFWISYSNASKAIVPASVETISASLNNNGSSKSYNAAKKYRVRTLLTLFLLLFFQVYWLIGATLQSDLKDLRVQLEKLSSEEEDGEAEQKSLKETAPDYAARKAELDAKYTKFNDRLWSAKISALADFAIIKHWNIAERFFLRENSQINLPSAGANPTDTEQRQPAEPEHFLWVYTSENITELQTSQIILTALLKYILPLLYGALGASAYIVRMVAEEIHTSTYSESSKVRYQLRFYLGAVAGLSIAWFTSDPKSAETAGILQSLSPLALAFLAGYSVDLLFSLLDRLVTAFSAPERRLV